MVRERKLKGYEFENTDNIFKFIQTRRWRIGLPECFRRANLKNTALANFLEVLES